MKITTAEEIQSMVSYMPPHALLLMPQEAKGLCEGLGPFHM